MLAFYPACTSQAQESKIKVSHPNSTASIHAILPWGTPRG